KVSDDLDLSQLAPLGCSVQTGVGTVLNVARPEPGSTVVVFGAGGVGLVAIMAAMLTPAARVVAVDVNAARLKLASELGATDTINPADSNPRQFIPRLIGLHRQGRLPFDRLIRFYPFDQIDVAAQDAAEGRSIKPVLILPT